MTILATVRMRFRRVRSCCLSVRLSAVTREQMTPKYVAADTLIALGGSLTYVVLKIGPRTQACLPL